MFFQTTIMPPLSSITLSASSIDQQGTTQYDVTWIVTSDSPVGQDTTVNVRYTDSEGVWGNHTMVIAANTNSAERTVVYTRGSVTYAAEFEILPGSGYAVSEISTGYVFINKFVEPAIVSARSTMTLQADGIRQTVVWRVLAEAAVQENTSVNVRYTDNNGVWVNDVLTIPAGYTDQIKAVDYTRKTSVYYVYYEILPGSGYTITTATQEMGIYPKQ